MEISNQIRNISQNPGVYIFKDKTGRILYIGKATNLKSRVSSYFSNSRKEDRPVMAILDRVDRIETQETDSVLEALILEANLIKKHQPPFNVDLKDDKSFSYVVITKEDFSRVLILRETELEKIQNSKNIPDTKYQILYTDKFGPYVSKKQLEVALRIIRKIFPYHSRKEKSEKGCLDFQIGLCPGPYSQAISKVDYGKNIRSIRMILSGKKKGLISKLKKEMEVFSKNQEFEKAGEIRNQIFALEHIRDVALIGEDKKAFSLSPTLPLRGRGKEEGTFRIEAYDISNISGKQAVGSMVVFENGEPNNKEYRKFRIKTVEDSNDVAMMAEVLFRRFRNDWPASTRGDGSSTRGWRKPDLILLDGGKGHLNMAEKVLKELNVDIPLVGVAKGPSRKISNFQFLISKQFPISNDQKELFKDKNFIGRIIEEAHRFAIAYHRKVRKRDLLPE